MRALRPMRRSLRAACLGGSLAVAASIAAPALGAPVKLVEGDVSLEYRRGPSTLSCPDEAALRERAADAFEFRDPFVAPGVAAAARMRVELTRDTRHYRGTIRILDAAGEVTAVATEQHVDCDALVWVLAHRIALALLRKPPPAPPSPPPPAPSAPPPAPSAPPPAATLSPPAPAPASPACNERCLNDLSRRISAPRVRLSPYSVSIGAGGLVTAGLTIDEGAGAWVSAALQGSWFSLGVEARGTLPAKAAILEGGRHSDLSTLSGVAAPCLRWKFLFGCAFVEVGVLVYQPAYASPPMVKSLIAVGPRVGVEMPLGQGISFRAFGDLTVRPMAPTFTSRLGRWYSSHTVSWDMPTANVIAGMGLAWSR